MSIFTDAAATRVQAVWPQGRVYKPRKIPAKPITPYVVLYADTGRSSIAMNDGTAGAGAHRLMPMAVGSTTDEVDRATAAVIEALSDHRLAVAGFDCTPLWLESSGNYVDDPDGGVLISQTLFLTFHATKESA
jgi:hypothetical protein